MQKFLPFLFIVIISCCKTREDYNIKPHLEGRPVTQIKLYNNIRDYPLEEISLSEFVDSVRFIRLETKEECLIGSIASVHFTGEEMIVTDKTNRKILIFDNNGKYLRKIGNSGRGPGEYLSIIVSNYDKERQIISIYDIETRKLLLYRLNGEFIRDIPIITKNQTLCVIYDMITLPNGNYLCFNSDQEIVGDMSGMWEVDSDGKFVKNLFKYKDIVPSVNAIHISDFNRLADGTIAFKDPMHHDIYHYKEGKLSRYISYDIENNILLNYIGESYTSERFPFCYIAQNKDNYIISQWYDIERSTFLSLYDKKRNKIKFSTKFDDSNIHNAMWVGNMVETNMSNSILISISSSVIAREVEKNTISNYAKMIYDSLNTNISEKEIETMNPIVEILYLKSK
jgi:hypothetical protein